MDAAVVHLACAEVATLLQQAPPPAQWLTPDEAQRLSGLRTDRRRDAFVGARWQARCLLAQVHGGEPWDWPLQAPRDAPPRVRGHGGLFLSISHSGARTACALATHSIGLDLEQPTRRRDVEGLVALCCTAAERARFEGLADAERDALFYALWTLKEAWLKRRGEWIAPQRLQQLSAMESAEGDLRTWGGEGWMLAATGSEFRWWTPQPAPSRSWQMTDLSLRA
jgi:4'-phosphopantetheinyl transferase